MTLKPQKKPHLQAINGLRFFAAIYVVLFHHGTNALSSLPEGVARFFKYGYTSVSLFFVLSGFVLAYTYLDSQDESRIDLRRFWTARFARIYPLYLVALLASAPAFVAKFGELGLFGSIGTGLSAISLLQAWTPWTSTVWNTPAWAVSVEAFCYFVFPFAAIRLSKLNSNRITILAGVFWILALILPVLHLWLFRPIFGDRSIWLISIVYHPLCHLPQFLIGICLGIIFLRYRAGQINFLPKYSQIYWLTLASSIATLVCLISYENLPYELLNNGLLAPLFSLIIWTLAHDRGAIAQFLSLPSCRILGEASYAIYLFQNPLLSAYKLILDKAAKQGAIANTFFNSFPFLIIYLLTLIAVAIIAFTWIENPARKYIVAQFSRN